MMRTNNFLFLMTLVSLFISCKKSNDSTNIVPTNTALLTNHSWKYVGRIVDTNNNGAADEALTAVAICLQDDSLRFKTDNTFQLLRGTVLCDDPLDPSADLDNSGTWQFFDNDTGLSYHENNNGETLSGKITQLTEDAFTFKIETINGSTLSPVEFNLYEK